MGAGKYDEKHVGIVQHLFDTRNLIVHSAGKTSAYYIKQYPKQFLQDGKIKIVASATLHWAESALNLVAATDAFVLKYLS